MVNFPGLGKSTILCGFAARITRSDALPDGEPTTPRAVLILSAEDDLHDTIRPRIDAAGGDPTHVIALIGAARGALLLAADPDNPERRILAASKSNLGVLPPSLAFHLEPVPQRFMIESRRPVLVEASLR